jgi:hypothetical protein
MSFVHKSSNECAKSELDLFHVPETQTMIFNGKDIFYYPVSSLQSNTPIEFNIVGSEEYIDLNSIYLYLEVKITKEDQTNLDKDALIAPVNNFKDSLFSQAEVYFNGQNVSGSNNTYAYRAFIETLTNFGADSKESHLTSELFYKDDAGQMDNVSTTDANQGWIKRRKITADSKTIDLYGKIHADVFFQPKYLLGMVDLKVKLIRSKTNFCLHGNNALSGHVDIQINKAMLVVRKAKINPEVVLAHNTILEKTTAKYPIRRVDVKTLTLSTGISSFVQDNISHGNSPIRVVIGFVDSDAYSGTLNKNPFNFKHFNLAKIALSLDGEEIPSPPIEMNFNDEKYILGYNSLYNGVDKFVSYSGNNINRDEYSKGYTLFAFDLTADMCNGSHFNLNRNGNLRLSLEWRNPLPNVVTCIIYMEYQNLIEINRNRQVICDFT